MPSDAIRAAYQRWGWDSRWFFDSLPDWVREHPDLEAVWDQVVAHRMIDPQGCLAAELEGVLRHRDLTASER
jgi:hypothetical protein